MELKPFNAKLEWCDALDTSVFDILLPFIENNSLPFHQPFYFKFYEAGCAGLSAKFLGQFRQSKQRKSKAQNLRHLNTIKSM